MNDVPTNPLFGNFQPTPIEPLKENPFTGETSTKPETAKQKKAREKKEATAAKKAAAAKPKPPRKSRAPKAATIKPVEPPVSNLQTLFAAMKDLHTEDHALFEKLLTASPASRKRVFVAIAKIFP